MIYVVRYRFFPGRRNTRLDNVCEKSIAIKSLTRKIIERCSTFILARIFPLKSKEPPSFDLHLDPVILVPVSVL